ncbi:MAG: hypothetical protein C4570_00765 [Ammonifex sp.]|jgi:hypothetical protein|nr:MAG: hypothetical protein C4570_00765 [Ammonifex sp.]
MTKRCFILFCIWLVSVTLGFTHCLAVLNRTLGTGEEITAFKFQALSGRSCQVEIVQTSCTFELPAQPGEIARKVEQEMRSWPERYRHALSLSPLGRP